MALRNIYYPDAKVSVLSNATRIDRPDVFDALNKVDNNILKLDSCFDETVRLIDVPASASFSVEKLIEGLCRFDRETPEKALRKAAPEKLDEIARRVEAMGIKAQVSY